MKELFKNIKKKIQKSNLIKLIKFKSIINNLNEKIGDLESEKKILNNN